MKNTNVLVYRAHHIFLNIVRGKGDVITVNMKEHPLCIINVYMPSDNSNRDEQYKDILSQLEEIIDKFQCQYFTLYSIAFSLDLCII
jgi:hypothetical protein